MYGLFSNVRKPKEEAAVQNFAGKFSRVTLPRDSRADRLLRGGASKIQERDSGGKRERERETRVSLAAESCS